MKLVITPRIDPNRAYLVSLFLMTLMMLSFTVLLRAQQPQLSLADLLIGLRSKKVSIADRNSILTEAVKQRGVTFTLSADIEKELATTGAQKALLDAIRQKGAIVKASAVVQPVPVATPAPPDFSFFQKRADSNFVKGEFAQALVDYNITIEMNSDEGAAYLNRGKTHYSLKSYDLAMRDFDKSIELDPKVASAYLNRGFSFERAGDTQKAMGDYQKAVDLDAANEQARLGLKRMQEEEAKIALAKMPPPPPLKISEPAKAPEMLNLGNLTTANAVKMVTPIYSPVAQRTNVEGRVTVNVEMDEKGNVVSAKAVNGHQLLRSAAEDAARKSKFKPALFNSKPIKASGSITYNFSIKGTR